MGLMNEDMLNDLKQFITATVSQATSDLVTKDDLKDNLRQLKQGLNARIDDLELKVDTISDALNDHLSDHEARITRLEQQAA